MITVKELIDQKIAVLQQEECTCVDIPSLDSGEMITEQCYRCQAIEALKASCMCGKCEKCVSLLLVHYRESPCECTFKIVQEEEVVFNDETGLEEVVMLDKQMVDVKCERCIQCDELQAVLDMYAQFKAAYIDESEYENYRLENGVIVSRETRTLEEIRADKIACIEGYKHTYVEWMEYLGRKQRCLDTDLTKMQGAERKLLSGEPSLNWYYPDGRVAVTEAKYFTDMIDLVTTRTQKAYDASYVIYDEVLSMTRDELKNYDVKVRFDEVFKSL